VRVLFANHTSQISGGEWALLDLLAGLPANVYPIVACPRGPLADAVGTLGIPVATVVGTDVSLRLHPLHTPRGVAHVLLTGVALKRLAKRTAAHLIHANSIRTGLMAAVSARLGGPPVIVNVQDCLPRTPMANLVRRILLRDAAVLIANSNYTAANFVGLKQSTAPVTIYNPIDFGRFDPQRISRADARMSLGLPETPPVLGLIGQITPWKGQDDAIRCVARLREKRPNLRLLLVGDAKFTSRATRYDNRGYARSLRQLADELGVEDIVQFLGERRDIPRILRALDLLLVPSWEEPLGRTVIEAMAMETPVLATNVGGPAEIITDGVDGMLLPPRRPAEWARAIDELLENPAGLAVIGRGGRRAVMYRFTRQAHVDRVVETYESLLSLQSN
jgi:glycosyltransferase involved in cell wall biosynthesis